MKKSFLSIIFIVLFIYSPGFALEIRNEFLPFIPFVRPSAVSINTLNEGLYLNTSLSNHYFKNLNSSSLILDYEQYNVSWTYLKKFANNTKLKITIPFHFYGGGVLDSTLSWWHQLWRLPNAGRHLTTHNQLRYLLEINGDQIINFNNTIPSGLGDLEIMLTGEWFKGLFFEPVLLLTVPTGNPDSLLGMGKLSGALGFVTYGHSLEMSWYLQGFLMEKYLPPIYAGVELTQPYQLDGGLSFPLLGLPITHTISIYQSPFANTGIEMLDRVGIIYYGFTSIYLANHKIDLFFQEDLSMSSAPDFTVGMAFIPN
jgi:hypothetical protein